MSREAAPRVSVLMPVYDAESDVAEAVESILGQTFRDFELLVLDDGSRDRSLEIVERVCGDDPRVRLFRNTHAGLTSIPADLIDSATALGLPVPARLRRIDLPLAIPAILAGIKTAAVINVGTATLGALIGAGGYGQPILTGIRLDDVGLILEGAVPAALLALMVQGGFELAERRLVGRL